MNAAEKTSTSRSPAFVSTVESSDIHDPMAMSGVDARYGVSISPGILTDNAPLSSQVPVPLSPRLSGRQLRPKSPSRNFEQALAAVNRKARSKRFVMPPVSWSNEKYYLKQILPLFRKHKVVHFNKTDARLANNGLPVELQKLRCRVNYNALKFTPRIEELGRRLVKMLQEKVFFYIVLHLRYEMDMLAFSGCTHGCTEEEANELTQMRYAYPWWKVKEIKSEQKRLEGLCPLTPEETALVFKALGFDKNTQIYIAAGQIYGGDFCWRPRIFVGEKT